ncbi:Stealth protein CR1, conserved region 1 [Lacrimispora sphenoides]|jgi:hypothetical protein|uniref:Stealth CR1 domain-containing protein n=1 Tax=Lacrimispora sphenoides TaxID=29370 RepID=UPI0008BB72E6|nr:Stealth CR1 domain-containing protein [Lacrimispora sphenoides]SET90590.1 Stealth protein CR1, conserved region 1 [Lacrimispora sphenoides]
MDIDKIDIVITWVDGNDNVWLKQKSEYEMKIKGIDTSSNNNARYRDWDNIQYIFRGIEKFMPWINKVHFVTWGHIPKWLNEDCPKLNIVNHKGFIPEAYLPTFNSNTIDLNLHRIPGLSEEFLNFNDDMFVIGDTKPTDFFHDGLPKDIAVISPAPCFRDVMCCTEANNFGIINDYFSVEDIKKNNRKWYTLKYGKFLVRTFIFSKFKSILGLFEPHIPFSHLKTTMTELWEKEYTVLDNTCKNKFRTRDDVNEWLFRHWQLMSGKFEPRRWNFGILMDVATQEDAIIELLRNPGKIKMVCINDTSRVEDFDVCKSRINDALQNLLPQKSQFEK